MSEDTPASYQGVGLLHHLGIEMVHSEEGRVVGRLIIGPEHLNRAGYAHGGVFCTLMDFAACAAGLHVEPGEPQRYGVTLALTTNFTKAVNKGTLTVEGKIIAAGLKTFTAEARVHDEAGDLVAHGIGTFQWRPGSSPSARSGQPAQSQNG
jgi:uncharacterized protein (TIGR00369 family)